MVDQVKTAVDAAADAAKSGVEAAGEAAKQVSATAVKASRQQAKALRATPNAATKTTKTAKRAKPRRTTAKAATRRAGTNKAARAQKPAASERTTQVNYDFSKGFAGFGVPAVPFQAFFADAGERSQDAVRRSQKAVEQIADLNRANVEAFVDAGKIAVEGVRSIGQDVVESGREGVEQAADAVRALAEAKSPTEFIELQSEFARAAFDRFVGESSRLTESVVKLAGEAFQPLSSRASINAERINKIVA